MRCRGAMRRATERSLSTTADPANGQAETMQVSAIHGLGELLVSGNATADQFIYDREGGTIIGREIAIKAARMDAVQGGIAEHEVAAGEAEQPAISDEEAVLLAQAGSRLEALFGNPQDIEWAIDRQRQLFILQSRPLQVAIKATEPIPEPKVSPLLQGGLCQYHDRQ